MTNLSIIDLVNLFSKKMGNRRYMRSGDPGIGIEYNKIKTNRYVCKKLHTVDIARTPNIRQSSKEKGEVHDYARKANSHNDYINFYKHRFHGRQR